MLEELYSIYFFCIFASSHETTDSMTIDIKIDNDVVTATLNGSLDITTAPQFAKDMQPLMDHASKHIIVDCAGLDFISSSGLRLFLTLRKKSLADGGKVTIRNVNPDVDNVFAITGFHTLFHVE